MNEAAPSPERAWLARLEFFGIKLGLENIVALLDASGNPHAGLRVVHVAGTNGKGSVLAFLDAMLRAAGYVTGRFISPHLLDVSERFLINAQPLSSPELDAHIAYFRDIAETTGRTPTYFELCTAVAFRAFHLAGVDIALVETGMGGRLDSTNVVSPMATAITSIDLDHMQYLGDTREAIAAEKAGILKEGCPVALGRMDEGARKVIVERAARLAAPTWILGQHFDGRVSASPWRPMFVYDSPTLELGPVPLGLAGRHQADNAALACALAMGLPAQFRAMTPESIAVGLAAARWPCRLERVCDDPPIIIDAAHNPHGMTHYPTLFKEAVVVFASSSDKNAAGMLGQLARIAKPLILTQYDGPRATDAKALAAAARSDARVIPRLSEALEAARELAGPTKPVLLTGSIFLAGEARALLIAQGLAAPLAF